MAKLAFPLDFPLGGALYRRLLQAYLQALRQKFIAAAAHRGVAAASLAGCELPPPLLAWAVFAAGERQFAALCSRLYLYQNSYENPHKKPRSVSRFTARPAVADHRLLWREHGVRQINLDLGRRKSGDKLTPLEAPPPLRRKVWQAKKLLQGACPEIHDEVFATLSEIVFIDGPNFNSASVPATFGAVYLSGGISGAVEAADLLVHEAAHHKFEMMSACQTYVTNPDTLCASAFRREARPVNAAFHSFFVIASVARALTAIIACAGARNRRIAQARLTAQLNAYRAAREAFGRSAKLTAAGRTLLRQLDRTVEAIG